MEIRVEESLTGRELRERILLRYGSERALAVSAARRGAHEARDDLLNLRLLGEDPARLEQTFRVTTIRSLGPRDLELLTPARLRLLDALAQARTERNVTELAAAMKRDKKNVSRDLAVLERLGLVHMVRRGRQAIPASTGHDIHIVLAGRARARRVSFADTRYDRVGAR